MMECKRYPLIGEECWRETLENGMELLVVPRARWSGSTVVCAVNYGGEDSGYLWRSAREETPEGTAHCLLGRLLALLKEAAPEGVECASRLEGSWMAVSLKTGPEEVYLGLKAALNAVKQINLTEKNPPKSWQTLLREAAGDGSVASLTPEGLARSCQAVMRPENMALCVAGGGEPKRVAAMARMILPEKGDGPILRLAKEGASGGLHQAEGGGKPLFRLDAPEGTPLRGERLLRRALAGELALGLLCRKAIRLYGNLRGKNRALAGESLRCEVEPGGGLTLWAGEACPTAPLCAALSSGAAALLREGIPERQLELVRRWGYGRRTMALDFHEAAAELARGALLGYDYFAFGALYPAVEAGEVAEVLRQIAAAPVFPVSKAETM